LAASYSGWRADSGISNNPNELGGDENCELVETSKDSASALAIILTAGSKVTVEPLAMRLCQERAKVAWGVQGTVSANPRTASFYASCGRAFFCSFSENAAAAR